MRTIIAIFISILMVTGCSAGSYTDVTVDEAKKMIDSGEVEVIDVRTPEEFSAGHIPDAKLMPLQVIDGMLSELDKEKKYLIVCRSGNRSAEASAILADNGFENIYNMTGGMSQWSFDIEQ